MKKSKIITRLFCFLFAVLFSLLGYLITKLKNTVTTFGTVSELNTVIVDAGHGGTDGGAVALDGSAEKDYNLAIALKLRDILILNGFNVVMTRTEDIMTCDEGLHSLRQKKVSDIHNRFNLTEKYSDAIYVSIHQNKFDDKSQHGTQVFYSKNNLKSKLLAEEIQHSVVASLQPENKRAIKKTGTEIFILYHSQIPTVLVECGFISNYSDLQNLKDEKYQSSIAILITQGIMNYKKNG